jgi:L-lactate dehydrogenase complex protein LldF
MTETGFGERYWKALANENIRHGLLSFQRDWKTARDVQVGELETITGQPFDRLSADFAGTKRATRENLTELTEQFEERVMATGGAVHHASDGVDACRVVESILAGGGVRQVVKTKSMVTEEIFLNGHLEGKGIDVVETDLGEWLLQLADEHPSHLVMPAIHKRRHEIARIIEDEVGEPFDPDDVTGMVRAARVALRRKFFTAGAGVTGANALVASTGSILLVTNEGNATLATLLPDIHVVVAGVDKLVPDTATAVDQIRLLGRSATGQQITSYTTMITSPRPGQSLHVVLVDNGRTTMAADEAFADALSCIRCGACADVCPPYQIVGGHVFGHVYTGAIGLVNTAFHHGLDQIADAQFLCVSCNACATVCPAAIPLPSQILRVRRQVFENHASRPKRWAMRLIRSRRLVGSATLAAAILTLPFRDGDHLRLRAPRRHRWRRIPSVPLRPARWRRLERTVSKTYPSEVTGRRVALFLQCLSDRLAPDIVAATATVIAAAGAEVVVPRSQHCCGLPAFDAGDWSVAKAMLKSTLDTFEDHDLVVTPAPSCLVALGHEYDALVENDRDLRDRLDDLRGRLFDLVGFLEGPGRPDNGHGRLERSSGTVGVHRFCQSSNVLDRHDRLERIVFEFTGIEPVPIPEADVCCGFGGGSSVAAPEVAAGIVVRKIETIDESGVDLVVTDNPGCILHLRASLDERGGGADVVHLAEFLTRS